MRGGACVLPAAGYLELARAAFVSLKIEANNFSVRQVHWQKEQEVARKTDMRSTFILNVIYKVGPMEEKVKKLLLIFAKQSKTIFQVQKQLALKKLS